LGSGLGRAWGGRKISMPNLREQLPNREQWILGIIPYAIILYFLFRHQQFMKVVAWLARLASQTG
jgi:hypothetical protein